MRLVTFDAGRGDRLGALLPGERLLDLTSAIPGPETASMLALIAAGPAALARVREAVARAEAGSAEHLTDAARARLRPPIPRPPKNVICTGMNYRSHVEQDAVALGKPLVMPKAPPFFSKPVTAVIGPGDAIVRDRRLTEQLDYEGELAVVIGRRGSWIGAHEAMDYVFGYTLGNDVSARDLQAQMTQFYYAKGLDTFCPLGPAIVDRDSMPSLDTVDVMLSVNDEPRQRESVGNLLFAIPTIIEHLSRGMTLEPGDIILTGTPGGCGYQMSPPRFLQPGDVVECSAESIGVLRNPVISAG